MDEQKLLRRLVSEAAFTTEFRRRVCSRATQLVKRIRSETPPTLMEHFLTEYGLSTEEGVALMCLAEAMLRIPDTQTIEALIEDKIVPSNWGQHLGEASSSFVNASTWALMLTGKVLDDHHPGIAGIIRGVIKRLGEPFIRVAVKQVMSEMGKQFVLGESIIKAMHRAKGFEKQGYTFSYDMLGEAAITQAHADRYEHAYSMAIDEIAKACHLDDVKANPGISVKLSALHPRYEVSQERRVLDELVPKLLGLAKKAKAVGMGFNIDAEEQDRLVLSLKVIKAVFCADELRGWNGFGVVVQAYGKRAAHVLDWLYEMATAVDAKLMVRLVKGAYWDSEMKHAQVEGLKDFTLFTTKVGTDVSYLTNAKKLFDYADRIYPQFATHNAHTVAAIVEMAAGRPFEFQRLHGMGESLHDTVLHDTELREQGTRCRIYAPVGQHQDLLAYLVRRLLENGANSSFVHQIVNKSVDPEQIAADPFEALDLKTLDKQKKLPLLMHPQAIFAPRQNSRGVDLNDDDQLAQLNNTRAYSFSRVESITVRRTTGILAAVHNPYSGELLTEVLEADAVSVTRVIEDAKLWDVGVDQRAGILLKAADLYEQNAAVIFEILAKEAGKTLADAVGELREAVDFLRYYADQAKLQKLEPAGIFVAISPWNFPLAIFTGQIAAGLAVGNAMIAKPAEATPTIAAFAVGLLHQAGVPLTALQCVHGQGAVVGKALTADARISGVVFTGSTQTALNIRKTMAENLPAWAPLIAETGGINAMIVDSTALLEQAVNDIVTSAFQSAGQRCSALRCLYVQEDIATALIDMLKGAMNELNLGDPWHRATDIGPIIDASAHRQIADYIAKQDQRGKVIHQLQSPCQLNTCQLNTRQRLIAPTLIEVEGISEIEQEIFAPVLHVATFKNNEIDRIINDINHKGYGLTFGLHTRIDSRVEYIASRIKVGNVYVNRNQIGAIVGSQPFGGEGLSGTGPKAGGPYYLLRFAKVLAQNTSEKWHTKASVETLQRHIQQAHKPNHISQIMLPAMLPGPTGEDNAFRLIAKGPILCAGPGTESANKQASSVEQLGGIAVIAGGDLSQADFVKLKGIHGVIWWGENAADIAKALAMRDGPIIPLITGQVDIAHIAHERHLCIDTTASGGNAALLAG